MGSRIITGDCVEAMKSMPSESVHAIVTDPPYELSFMGKSWDSTGIAYNVDMWKEALRVLKPGGHLLAFGGTRTFHRMACAIEDAGFEVRDAICYAYGSGFPKSLNVAKAIDRAAGVQPEVVGTETRYNEPSGIVNAGRGADARTLIERNITAPVTDDAKKWNGYGSAMKPAIEPICVARKPLIGTIAHNVLTHGTGAINIDACRVGDEEHAVNVNDFSEHYGTVINDKPVPKIGERTVVGRWPANLIHDGSDEVVALFPEEAGGGTTTVKIGRSPNMGRNGVYGESGIVGGRLYDDSGSASRFFQSCPFTRADDWAPLFYCAKASTAEREEGLEGFEKKAHLQGLDTRGRTLERDDGSATLVERFVPSERANTHATVKPVTLMEYLVKLVTPPGGTVLDPFLGSGTTGVACANLDVDFVGIEKEEEYVRIAQARIAHSEKKAVVRKQQKGLMDFD